MGGLLLLGALGKLGDLGLEGLDHLVHGCGRRELGGCSLLLRVILGLELLGRRRRLWGGLELLLGRLRLGLELLLGLLLLLLLV